MVCLGPCERLGGCRPSAWGAGLYGDVSTVGVHPRGGTTRAGVIAVFGRKTKRARSSANGLGPRLTDYADVEQLRRTPLQNEASPRIAGLDDVSL